MMAVRYGTAVRQDGRGADYGISAEMMRTAAKRNDRGETKQNDRAAFCDYIICRHSSQSKTNISAAVRSETSSFHQHHYRVEYVDTYNIRLLVSMAIFSFRIICIAIFEHV